jgi:hypothetical protein
MFVVILDILKYWFGIDVTDVELKQIQKKKKILKRKPHIVLRFIYVNPPASTPS